MSTEPSGNARKPNDNTKSLLILLILVVLGFVVLPMISNRLREPNAPPTTIRPTRPVSSSSSSSGFVEVRNDCGLCGTSSPVGGWESANGRALILNDDSTFIAMFDDGDPMIGNWEKDGSKLCLSLATGAKSCFSYQQKVDAMKLDNAIYIRQ